MKELKCFSCSTYLGEIEKGKIKNGSVILCASCFKNHKATDDFNNYIKSTASNNMPEFFKDIFNKKV